MRVAAQRPTPGAGVPVVIVQPVRARLCNPDGEPVFQTLPGDKPVERVGGDQQAAAQPAQRSTVSCCATSLSPWRRVAAYRQSGLQGKRGGALRRARIYLVILHNYPRASARFRPQAGRRLLTTHYRARNSLATNGFMFADCELARGAQSQPTEFSTAPSDAPGSCASVISRHCIRSRASGSAGIGLQHADVDGARAFMECPAPPAMPRIGHHRDRPADAFGRQRRDAGLQRQPGPRRRRACPPGKITICASLVQARGRLAQQSAHRRRAAAAVDRDHAAERQQRAEQRDAQQFLLQHVAAARQQTSARRPCRTPTGASRRSAPAPWTCQGSEAVTPRGRMPQITRCAHT